jgi:beta-lactam-binding protein with PASTA domain
VISCHVPTLRGVKLARAKRLLHKNHCGVGKVTRRRSGRRMIGKVLASKPAARSVKPKGTKVSLVLGKRR